MTNEHPLTHNCHYISRFLMSPWEDGDKFLRFYDFDTDSFGRRSSKSLFAGEHLNSPVVEQWLGRVVETPLGAIRDSVAGGDLTALETEKRNFRAAMLMLWLQGVRVRTLDDHDARRHLETLAALPETDLDALVWQMTQSYDLRLCRAEWSGDAYAPLSFPSTGVFEMVLPDRGCQSGNSFGIGLPISVTAALIATPKEDYAPLDLSHVIPMLMCSSVGSGTARRVVLAPDLYRSLDEPAIRRLLVSQRVQNAKLLTLATDAQHLVVEMFAISGIDVGRDAAGRIPPRNPLLEG